MIIKQEAVGSALLRNGVVHVTAVEVLLDGTQAIIEVRNSRGSLSTGNIWIGRADLVELCRKVIAAEEVDDVHS